MEEKTELVKVESIQNKVYTIRGQQVMLDADLAEIYGYEVKALNQQVKCNISRFPEDFMFQLTRNEIESVKSQFVTSPSNNFFEGQDGGRRKLPYAFTEQGIYMLATVLRGELAPVLLRQICALCIKFQIFFVQNHNRHFFLSTI